MRFRHVSRGGPYVRVADPAWLRPLDPRFAHERGSRWNPPHSFPVVYLCATRDVARAAVLRRFEGLPYGVVDLLPSRAPVLIATDVPEGRLVEVVGDAGCRATGLPATYPLDGYGRTIAWARTQPVGGRHGSRESGASHAGARRRSGGSDARSWPGSSADPRIVSGSPGGARSRIGSRPAMPGRERGSRRGPSPNGPAAAPRPPEPVRRRARRGRGSRARSRRARRCVHGTP